MKTASDDHIYRVLVLDDDKFVLFTISACLKGSSFAAEMASTANEALQLFRNNKFDAVISDILMNSVDGFMFRDMIRKYNKQIPFIFLTSLVNDIDNSLMARIMQDNHSHYLSKNFNRSFLLAKLDQAIKSYHAETAVSVLEKEIQDNLDLASRLQAAMLPPWAHIDAHYEFGYLYRPLDKISGDLFEWIPLNEDSCLCIFGDISGHGTHSALAMTAVQSFLKQLIAISPNDAWQPHLVARRINEFFCQKLRGCTYMSTLIMIWDFKQNILRFHNAGYPDPLCFDTTTGESILLNPERKGSLPLGLILNAEYLAEDSVETTFTDDSLFVTFSDGLLDLSESTDIDAGMDMSMFMRMAATLAQQSLVEDSTITIPFRCYEALEQIGYNEPQDDFSMFVIRKPKPRADNKFFICRIPPDNHAVDGVAKDAAEFVLVNFKSEETAGKMEILLSEFLVNIVKHGLDGNRNVYDFLVIKLHGDDTQVQVTVWDRGKKWKSSGLELHDELDNILQELNLNNAQSGRGIPLMLKITPHIVRNRHCGLNETIFTIPINREPGEDA